MAKAYQCDRCMRYYTANKEVVPPGKGTDVHAIGVILLNDSNTSDKQYELCDDCLAEFIDWIKFRNK